MNPRRASICCLAFGAVVGGLWALPSLWYSSAKANRPFVWLTGKTAVADWQFRDSKVSESTEATLVADATVNGEFLLAGGRLVRVFVAKRFEENSVGMGVLGHPPDLCWTLAGWKLTRVEPAFVDCSVGGLDFRWERRLFEISGHKELVYYGALVGGQPLPYRLDQYLAWAGTKPEHETAFAHFGSHLRDKSYWQPVWEAFRNRVPLSGPQEFFRVSTQVMGDDFQAADDLLRRFLPQWLERGDYRQEYGEWQRAKDKGERVVGNADHETTAHETVGR